MLITETLCMKCVKSRLLRVGMFTIVMEPKVADIISLVSIQNCDKYFAGSTECPYVYTTQNYSEKV